MFMRARNSEIFVDKSDILSVLNSKLNTEQEYVCVSRPRRFGKSITANMVAAYYDKNCHVEKDFQGLKIMEEPSVPGHANRYNVIKINMQDFLSRTENISGMLVRLQKRVLREITAEYPDVDYFDRNSLTDCLEDVYSETSCPYVIVIDEWDCIFREFPHDTEAQKLYLDFLRDWLKDKSYISLVYMTGILPIKKYGTHSALNMFTEYSMENPGEMAGFVGFTENEVGALCHRYGMDPDECHHWYDGYYFPQCGHIFNPKSIVSAMLSGTFDDYWNKTETYEALKIYIDMNYDGLKDKLVALLAGARVPIDPGHFQNDMTTFSSADDVLTLLIHLGYLGFDFETRDVFIPNREIQMEFVRAMDDNRWDALQKAVRQSVQLLQDVWNKNADAVADGIEQAHLETSHLQYNDENALSYTVSLALYAARQYYSVVRELPSGRGFADLTFIPRPRYMDKPAMIVELKWDKNAETAIRQIHEKQYTGALTDYRKNMLLVGITYDRKTKKHTCVIEESQE